MEKLLVYLKDYKKESILAPLFKMLEATFELLVPIVMALVIDIGIGNKDKPYIFKMCLVFVALGLIGLACSITAQYFSAKAAVGFSARLRHALFGHIQKLSFTEMDTIGTSTLITRMTSDINQVQNGVNMTLRLFLRSPYIVFGAMIMAFTIDAKAAAVFAVTIPLLSVLVFGIMLISIPLYKKVQGKLDIVLGITRENLTGARVIRAFNKEEDETVHFAENNDLLSKMQLFVGKISALMNPVTYIMVNLATLALIYIGAIRVDTGYITQGQVIALVSYMAQILIELIKLANLIITITKAVACANRIQNILDIKPSMEFPGKLEKEAEGNQETEGNQEAEGGKETEGIQKTNDITEIQKTKETAENLQEESQPNVKYPDNREKSTESDDAVTFEHVSLTYKNAGAESITDISFHVKKGQTIGIIGGTGSGKSSLVNLIPRFYDVTKGRVLIHGMDVRSYPMAELRSKIGMVMQKAVLFKGSIRGNLQWGKANATEEEMMQALDVSQAKRFVEKKGGGLDAKIEQGGKNLSGGQKQRLTIARALVKKPEILILDDSSSALDFTTDARLRKALREMKEQPTIFIVSQRASSIRHADRIIVLDDGEMRGIGTHEELLESCPLYQEIYYSQFDKEAI